MEKLKVVELGVYEGTATITIEISTRDLLDLIVETSTELESLLEKTLRDALFEQE